MSRNARTRNKPLGFEPLEGRALLSVAGLKPPHESGAAIMGRLKHELQSTGNTAALQAIENALDGGAGSEFVKLILKEVHNPFSVIKHFSGSTPYQYTIKGVVAKTPNLQSGYTGLPHDALALTIGGAVELKKKQIELGAIARGPFTTTPFATTIVFAINRGAGQRLGPYYPGRPGITPDALVSVTVGPYGRNNSATITDLTTGLTQTISSPVIQVAGPTVRILLNSSQLPSEGFSLKHYTFAVWAATEPNAPFQDVGSFVPEDSMIPIGVETNVNPTL
jgi:hypothetical protein